MITFYFTNGVVLTIRTSGTEPKIKYYSEMCGQVGVWVVVWSACMPRMSSAVSWRCTLPRASYDFELLSVNCNESILLNVVWMSLSSVSILNLENRAFTVDTKRSSQSSRNSWMLCVKNSISQRRTDFWLVRLSSTLRNFQWSRCQPLLLSRFVRSAVHSGNCVEINIQNILELTDDDQNVRLCQLTISASRFIHLVSMGSSSSLAWLIVDVDRQHFSYEQSARCNRKMCG